MTPRIPIRRGAAAVLLLGAGALALWWHRGTPQTAPAAKADEASQAAQTPQPWAELLRSRPRHHVQKALGGRYLLDAQVTLAANLGQQQHNQEVRLSGEIEFAPATDRQLAAAGWLVGRVADLRAQGDAELVQQLQLQPGQGQRPQAFAIRVDERGEVQERRFAAASPLGQRNLLAAAVAAVQVVQPAQGASAARWQTSEQGASVPQYAEYASEGRGQLRKSWSRQRREAGGERLDGGDRTEGSAVLRYKGEALQEAIIDQLVDVDLSLVDQLPQHYAVRSHLQLTWQGPLAKGAAAQLPSPAPLMTEASFEPLRQRAPLQVSTRGVGEIVGSAERAHQARDWAGRRQNAHELAANLGQPAAMQQVRQLLWQGTAPADTLRTLVEALGTTSAPAGRQTLAQLLADKQAPATSRWHAAALMVTLHAPEPALVEALMTASRDESDDIYKTATAALAAVVHRARKLDPGAERQAYQYLLQRAQGAFAADEPALGSQRHGGKRDEGASRNPMLYLMALGNLGGAEVFALVQPYLVDRREPMRRHAIEALRFVPIQAARLALVQALQRDPSPYNRRLAAETALYHPQYLMEEHVVRALREDLHPEVQLGAAWTLAVWGVTAPALYAEIRGAAQRASNPQLAKTLEQMAVKSLDDSDPAVQQALQSAGAGAAPPQEQSP